MIDQRNNRHSGESQVGKQEATAVPSSITSINAVKMQASLNVIMRRNMLVKSIYDDVLTRPNPVNLDNMNNQRKSSNCTIGNNNVFHSFMGQYWDDLPNNMSSSQVVDEIIATFQQR